MASPITGVSMVCSNFCSSTDPRKHQSSASQALLWGIHRWPANSPHKGPVTRKCFHLMMSLCEIYACSRPFHLRPAAVSFEQIEAKIRKKRSILLRTFASMKMILILINIIPLKFAPKGLIYNNSLLVQVKCWFRTDNKLLIGPLIYWLKVWNYINCFRVWWYFR